MPSRRSTPKEPQPRPRLRKSHEEAKRLLEDRIAIGQDIAGRIHAGAFVPGAADGFSQEISRWSSYNAELLRQLFDTDEVAGDYNYFGIAFIGGYESEFERLKELQERALDRVNRLRTVVEKLPLYELTSEPTLVPAKPEPSYGEPVVRPSTVIKISHSTFGTLNTGEVLGSINSHVAATTGVTAEEFRIATKELAAQIAQDGAFTDQQRRELLEDLDFLAETAAKPPEKRRLGMVRRTLAAMPDLLRVSAAGIDAWDKYSEPIRRHFSL